MISYLTNTFNDAFRFVGCLHPLSKAPKNIGVMYKFKKELNIFKIFDCDVAFSLNRQVGQR